MPLLQDILTQEDINTVIGKSYFKVKQPINMSLFSEKQGVIPELKIIDSIVEEVILLLEKSKEKELS